MCTIYVCTYKIYIRYIGTELANIYGYRTCFVGKTSYTIDTTATGQHAVICKSVQQRYSPHSYKCNIYARARTHIHTLLRFINVSAISIVCTNQHRYPIYLDLRRHRCIFPQRIAFPFCSNKRHSDQR